MINGFWGYLALAKSFYRNCFDVVCKKHSLNRTELDIIIFLYENPDNDTATEITEKRGIAKSNVSTAIRNLIGQNYIDGYYDGGNRRSIHLKLLDKCRPVIEDAKKAKEKFNIAVFKGFDNNDIELIKTLFYRLANNISEAKKKISNNMEGK